MGLPHLRHALIESGVEPHGSPDDYKRALRPSTGTSWPACTERWRPTAGRAAYRSSGCSSPASGGRTTALEERALLLSARAAGFSQVIDVTDAYDGLDTALLAIDTDDFHPNATGHHCLARPARSRLEPLPELRMLWEAELCCPSSSRSPSKSGVRRRGRPPQT